MIDTEDDIAHALAALKRADPRLEAVHARAGAVPLRRSVGGLRGLAATIVAQQVSRASADAIFTRLAAAVNLDDPRALHAASEATLRGAGLSGPKCRTFIAIGTALAEGRLDLARIAQASVPDAIAEMTAVHGIGTWTAECYLLFSLGHPDVFPAGDLALQAAVAHALELPARPDPRALVPLATIWSPHRSTAARLFWAYYAAVARRDAVPLETSVEAGPPGAHAKPEDKGAAPSRRRKRGFTKAT